MKPWYLSKTMWVSILTAVVGFLTVLGDFPPIQQNPIIAGKVIMVIGAVNLILRMLTKDPILGLGGSKS